VTSASTSMDSNTNAEDKRLSQPELIVGCGHGGRQGGGERDVDGE
jgi:hypothetical protein